MSRQPGYNVPEKRSAVTTLLMGASAVSSSHEDYRDNRAGCAGEDVTHKSKWVLLHSQPNVSFSCLSSPRIPLVLYRETIFSCQWERVTSPRAHQNAFKAFRLLLKVSSWLFLASGTPVLPRKLAGRHHSLRMPMEIYEQYLKQNVIGPGGLDLHKCIRHWKSMSNS